MTTQAERMANRGMALIRPGDYVIDEHGRERKVIRFGDPKFSCPDTHISSPGSRIIYATWVDDVCWHNPPTGCAVWEHTLTMKD